MNMARYILGISIATVGVIILLFHLILFVRGIIFRRQTPSALPLVNFFILTIGFGLLPIPFGLKLGLGLAIVDSALWIPVNLFRR